MSSYLDDAGYIFKREYADDQLGEHTERDHALMAMLSKKRGIGGEDFRYPTRYGNPQGVGGTFANTQTNAAKSKGKQWAVEPVLKYGTLQIDGPSLQRASGSKSSFYDLVTGETDGILRQLGADVAFDTYRLGNGMRGRRSSASTNVITLTRADDVRNFFEGMTVIADDTITGASPRSGTTTVTSVNEDGATITLASAAAITSFADSDYLFRDGDPGTCMDGLELHIPLTAPTSGDSFRGVDRSVNVRKLAGVRVDDTASYLEENVGLAAVKIANNFMKANKAFANPVNVWGASKRLNAKIEYEQGGSSAEMYFQYITINTPAGAIKLVADADCPVDRFFIGDFDNFFYRYLGESFVHTIKDDGKSSLRQSSADGIESRFRVHGNTICPLPGSLGIGSI
jgi:hypothetical protein